MSVQTKRNRSSSNSESFGTPGSPPSSPLSTDLSCADPEELPSRLSSALVHLPLASDCGLPAHGKALPLLAFQLIFCWCDTNPVIHYSAQMGSTKNAWAGPKFLNVSLRCRCKCRFGVHLDFPYKASNLRQNWRR